MRLIRYYTLVGVFLLCAGGYPAFSDTASYYTYDSCVREGKSGVWTASGERYNENDLTCAMRRRDWGGTYKVTNVANGKSVIVRHNDYGPNKKLHDSGRITDLSKGAFEKIAYLRQGVITVTVEKVS
jgi:rare lipoprotein A